MRVAKRAIFEGRVQGVGFRATTRGIAAGFEVVGWVRNLPDGRVELLAVGEDPEVTEFLEEIREESSLRSFIKACELADLSLDEVDAANLKGFSIMR